MVFLEANATIIQQCIKRVRHFFDKVDIKTISRTLMENPSVVGAIDYGTNIGDTAMLMYACPECKETMVRAMDWFNGILAAIKKGKVTELIHWAWFCALCGKKFDTKQWWKLRTFLCQNSKKNKHRSSK